jgi:hypothetical protein
MSASAPQLGGYGMSKAMIAVLILAKIKTGNMEKRLCLAIKKATNILIGETA